MTENSRQNFPCHAEILGILWYIQNSELVLANDGLLAGNLGRICMS
jgi:hypothetical protein